MLEEYGLHELVWETCDQVFPDVFVASPADAEGRGISLSVLEGGEDCDLTGARVYLAWRHELTRKRGTCEFSAVDASAGKFLLYYPDALQEAEGEIAAQVVVSIGDDRAVSSRVFSIRCEKVVVGGEECADGFSLFVEAIKSFEKASTITYAAADAANAAASAANTAASEADAVKDEILADKAAGLFDGTDGKDGKDGADGAQGPVGPKGDKGDKGDTGEQGPRGDTGATGATGPKGDVGETGAAGPQGEKGDTGPKGDKGDKGDTGDVGPQGEQGIQGPKGDTGEQGPAGNDGLAATIAVGTVATGDTPSVVNVGTATAAIFNFVFPAGGGGEGGSGMKVKQIQFVSKTGNSMGFVKGSLAGVCYYACDANSIYEWDGSAWEAATIDADTTYVFQGQPYPVVSGVIWGLGENWGSQDLRTYVSRDESGYMDIAIVSDCSIIRQREVPCAIAYSSMSTGPDQGSNYVKRVDLTGCSASQFGESANTGMLQGMTNCQELLLPVGSTLYCYVFLANLNTAGSTAVNTIHGYGKGGRKRPVLMFGGSVDEGTGPAIGFSSSTFIKLAVCDFTYKNVGNTTMHQPATMGGTYAEYLASLVSFSAGYSTSCIQDVLHYDLWGCFTVTYTSTSTSYPLFCVTGNTDCVFEVGSASFPVTQAVLDAWGGVTYWVRQTNTGRVILVLYTVDGAELTVPEHTGAADLVVVFKDAATRSVEAFHERYDFATLFNTSTTVDPRPDLTGDGITYA